MLTFLLNPENLESLTFQYPNWYLIFCVLAGVIGALLLYFRDDTFKDQPSWFKYVLGTLRFLSIGLIALLLLEPLLKSLITETKKPIVVIAQDVSESIGNEFSEEQRTEYQGVITNLKNQLEEKYEVRTYGFGSEVREGLNFEFKDKVSDVSEMVQSVYDNYSNQNLGAVILASDGIYNKGSNPLYTGSKLAVPIYTVALGDTTPKRDLLIKRVFNNKIVYLGDKFSIQLDIAAINSTASKSNLTISKIEGDQVRKLKDIPININKNDFFSTQEVILDADQAGVQRYRLSLSKIAGEVTTSNNTKDIFIDVLDARQKILILANAPHPDISAIKQTLEKAKNYEVSTDYIGNLKQNINNFDFVIMHQLPSISNSASTVLAALDQKKMPRLYIGGMQTDYSALNNLQPFISSKTNNKNTNDVQATVATNFNLFTISEEVRNGLPKFAPLTSPFGEFEEVGNGQTLLYQKISKVETKYPLLTMGESNGMRVGVLNAEGIYKWRLFDFLQNKNHDIFEEVMSKTVQYLSLKEDKRKFRVSHSKNIYNENEPIIFDAELYNENFELINDPDATVTLTNSSGKSFPFTFNKTGRTYSQNVGIFPVGNYTYKGMVMSAGQKLEYTGQFSVQPVQLEGFETTANHGMLKLLAEQSGGNLLYLNQLASLPSMLEAQGTVKPVIYNTSKTRSIINLRWLFFGLFLLLGLEWFLRRFYGSY